MNTPTTAGDVFPADVLRVVRATSVSELSPPVGRRQEWEARLARLLTHPLERNAYEAAFDELLDSSPLPPHVSENLYETEIRADEIVRSGLGVLSDVELVTLAARPEGLQVVAELIEEAVDEPDAWPEWRRLLADAERAELSEVRPELIAKLTDIARAHPAYAGGGRPEPRPSKAFRLAPVWAALAACILIALGFVGGRLSRPRGPEVALAARVTAARFPDRGGTGRVTKLEIENRSDRRVFVTVIGLGGARPPVEYEENRTFIEVGTAESRTVELPASRFGNVGSAVVVLTATPAGEAVVKRLEEDPLPADPEAALDRIKSDLARYGFSGAVVELVPLPPTDR